MQMYQQDQPCPPESQSLLDETDAPSILGSRRRLSYSNGRSTSAPGQGPSGVGGAAEKNQKRGEASKSAGIFLTSVLLPKDEFVGFLFLRNKTEHG